MAKERINPATLNRPAAYTQVVTAQGGKLVFLAGQTPIDAQGDVVGAGDLRAQVRQVYENIGRALDAAGASFADVVKLTAYVVNYTPEARTVIGEVRRDFVSEGNLPAHTLLGVQALAREEFLIEVDTVAVVDTGSAPRLRHVMKPALAGTAVILAGAAVSHRLRRLFRNR